MSEQCEKPSTGPLKITRIENKEVMIGKEKYYATSITAKGVPLAFPIISKAPVTNEEILKITEDVGVLLKKIEIYKTCRRGLSDLLKEIFNKKDLPQAIGKGNKSAIVVGGDWIGSDKETLITAENLLKLFGYPTNTDANGNYITAQKLKDKILPKELSNDRLIGIFNDWLSAISKK